MKGFLSTAGTVSASTGGPSPSNLSLATATNSISGSRNQLNTGNSNISMQFHLYWKSNNNFEVLLELFTGECRVDLATTKKTPTLGLHRIAKLLGNENKMNRSAGWDKTYISLQCHHYNRYNFCPIAVHLSLVTSGYKILQSENYKIFERNLEVVEVIIFWIDFFIRVKLSIYKTIHLCRSSS